MDNFFDDEGLLFSLPIFEIKKGKGNASPLPFFCYVFRLPATWSLRMPARILAFNLSSVACCT